MLLGQGEVPGWTEIDESTTEMSWTSGTDPWDDFDLEFQQEPKSIWGWFSDETTLETTTEALVCLEWSWFGFCKLYGPRETVTTTFTTTSTTTSTTTTTTTTTTSSTTTTFYGKSLKKEIMLNRI